MTYKYIVGTALKYVCPALMAGTFISFAWGTIQDKSGESARPRDGLISRALGYERYEHCDLVGEDVGQREWYCNMFALPFIDRGTNQRAYNYESHATLRYTVGEAANPFLEMGLELFLLYIGLRLREKEKP